MAKKITGYINLQVPAGDAKPAPPIGPALGQRGVNIREYSKAINIKSGSKEPGKTVAGKIKRSQLSEIAQVKMKDLNANDIDAATKIIEGSARAMGLEVTEG